MSYNSFSFRVKFWFYRLFVIVPSHRKIKRLTRVYWEDFEKAKKSDDIKEVLTAAIRLNQALEEYRQQQKDQLFFYKSGSIEMGEPQVSSKTP